MENGGFLYRQCRRCKIKKLKTEFYKQSRGGFSTICRECKNIEARESTIRREKERHDLNLLFLRSRDDFLDFRTFYEPKLTPEERAFLRKVVTDYSLWINKKVNNENELLD